MRRFDRHKMRNLRLSKGYSLGVMARLLRLKTGHAISRTAISNWETGKSRPSMESVLAISELYDVPVDYFFEPKSNYLLEALAAMSLYNQSGKKDADLNLRKLLEQDQDRSAPARKS